MVDPEMCEYELQILRVMAGEEVSGVSAGAAMWSAAAWLKGRGYAVGHYEISQKGREYLANLPTPDALKGDN